VPLASTPRKHSASPSLVRSGTLPRRSIQRFDFVAHPERALKRAAPDTSTLCREGKRSSPRALSMRVYEAKIVYTLISDGEQRPWIVLRKSRVPPPCIRNESTSGSVLLRLLKSKRTVRWVVIWLRWERQPPAWLLLGKCFAGRFSREQLHWWFPTTIRQEIRLLARPTFR